MCSADRQMTNTRAVPCMGLLRLAPIRHYSFHSNSLSRLMYMYFFNNDDHVQHIHLIPNVIVNII